MAGWRGRLDGREFEEALGGGDGQGGLSRRRAAVRGVAESRTQVSH